ncbi:WxL domain-containing protein [Companilactobacillus allii]|uniref:WxL domain-containing protein n=1 Tax=Companilactobacillus allii TaxID=1847728 RepID=A0A1P8Q0D5_9LACO|nr:WxL domain-containing protein [Companilactobacillus allii]APX71296.1 hypothetical protein BTM29_01450 [Companilactobacillus allii]USQ68378.1 WxL domain-containing protein [Companilactobacillus allii]
MRFDKKLLSKLLIASSFLLTSAIIASPTVAHADTVTPQTSSVSVQIISGVLTLDKVPNFNFGSAVLGGTTNLKGNSVTDVPSDFTPNEQAGVDGSDEGVVQVTESRSNAETGDTPGFILSASISPLYPYDTSKSSISGNILTLNSVPLVDSTNTNVSTSTKDLKTSKANISDTDTGDTSLMDLSAGSYRMGTVAAKWNSANDASLFVNGSSDGASTKVDKYNAVITWRLTAQPSITN